MGQRAQGSLQRNHQLDVMNRRRVRLTHAEERRDAGALNFEDVVIRTDRKILTRESERHVGELISFRAFDSVLAVIAFLCADFLVAVLD